MKALMNYGVNESKESPFSSIEYQKEGADGKVYGIIREGSKYYIKIADKKKKGEELVSEDFNYIGGFRNRKVNEYNGFANAQKNFELKLKSLNEAKMNNKVLVESWDLDKKEIVVMEASNKMKNEIARQKNIMENAKTIFEGNKNEPKVANLYNGGKDEKKVGAEFAASQKNNMPEQKPETSGDPKKANKEYTDADINQECGLKEETEVLAWNRKGEKPMHDHYMDKSHGTEIGDGDPFDEPVTEGDDSMVYDHSDDQNSPDPGVGEVGDGKPFGVNEAEEGEEVMPEDGMDDGMEEDPGMGENEFDMELDNDETGEPAGDEPMEEPVDDEIGDDEEDGAEVFYDDLGERMDNMEKLLGSIADKLGIDIPTVDSDDYEDDDLYGDIEDDEEEPEDEADIELELDDDEPMDTDDEEPMDTDDEELPMESRRRNRPVVYETRAFKRAIREDSMKPFRDQGRVPANNMNKLDDFGKHPAYRKKVMSLPPKDFKEFDGYYDMNDETVRNDTPYGTNIGSSAPFEIDPKSIDRAIAESLNRIKKKSSRR